MGVAGVRITVEQGEWSSKFELGGDFPSSISVSTSCATLTQNLPDLDLDSLDLDNVELVQVEVPEEGWHLYTLRQGRSSAAAPLE